MQDRLDGPYVVDKMTAPGAYRLRGLPKGLPEVWNQDKLRLYRRERKAFRILRQHEGAARLKVTPSGGVSREVEAIIGVRPGRTRNTKDFLVQWRNVPAASWEKERNLTGCRHLVDQFLAAHSSASSSGLTSEAGPPA